MKKQFYITLDFEEDVGSATKVNTYFSHQGSKDFIQYIKEQGLNVTLFITGEILERYPDLIQPYIDEKDHFQFEFHSYNHENVYDSAASRIENIDAGLSAYKKFFNKLPSLYRAPDGMIARKDLEFLIKSGILSGSNFFPTLFPGRFNNLHIPQSPFGISGTPYIEIPFSTTKAFRLPIALSYIQLFGYSFYKNLLDFNKPEVIIFDMHLHDLYPEYWYGKIKVPFSHKAGHYRMSRSKIAFETFKKVIDYFKNEDYEFHLLKTLTTSLKETNPKSLKMEEIFK